MLNEKSVNINNYGELIDKVVDYVDSQKNFSIDI